MTIRIASRLRIIIHDVTGRKPRYMSSFVVEVSELPADFIQWLRAAAGGQFGNGKTAFPTPAIAGEKPVRPEPRGGAAKRLAAAKKGGRRGNTKA